MTNTNLPSSWTKGKMTKLLLLSGLSSFTGVQAGQAYENCLIYEFENSVFFNYYQALLNYPFSDNSTVLDSGSTVQLCCNTNQCTPWNGISCPNPNIDDFAGCYKINGMIVCDGSYCTGVVGNNTVTKNATIGSSCTDLNTVANYISSLPANNVTGLDQGFAEFECYDGPCKNEGGIECGWDNGGLTCFSDCVYQWVATWPGPANLNPFSTSSSLFSESSVSVTSVTNPTNIQSSGINTFSSFFSSSPLTTAPLSSGTNNAPIIVGFTVGGTGLVGGGGLAYYFWRKRNRQNQNLISQRTANPIISIDLRPISRDDRTREEIILPALSAEVKKAELGFGQSGVFANLPITATSTTPAVSDVNLVTTTAEDSPPAYSETYQTENNQLVAQIQQVGY